MTVIYSCAVCGGDLEDEAFGLYCPACERTVSPAEIMNDPWEDHDDDF